MEYIFSILIRILVDCVSKGIEEFADQLKILHKFIFYELTTFKMCTKLSMSLIDIYWLKECLQDTIKL